jgi:hypothetical protein
MTWHSCYKHIYIINILHTLSFCTMKEYSLACDFTLNWVHQMITRVSCVLLFSKSWTYTCIFSTYETCIVFIDSFFDNGLKKHLVLLEGVLRIIFKELDPIWLVSMWRASSESCHNMLDIIFMLYLVKCRQGWSQASNFGGQD